jgi:hypothetical protein
MLSYFKVPIGWGELFKRTANESMEDDVLGLSAQLAYYFFLALFPALLFLVALASFFHLGGMTEQITRALSGSRRPTSWRSSGRSSSRSRGAGTAGCSRSGCCSPCGAPRRRWSPS